MERGMSDVLQHVRAHLGNVQSEIQRAIDALDQAIREADIPRVSDKHLLEQVRSHLDDAAAGAFAPKMPSDTIGTVAGRSKSNPLLRRLRSARHVSIEKSQGAVSDLAAPEAG
jgi:hypothetical protein